MTQTANPVHLEPANPSPTRRRRRFLTVVSIAAVTLLLVAAVFGLLLERQRAYDRLIERIERAFPADAGRPRRGSGGAARAENWLLLGSDLRSDQASTGLNGDDSQWRSGSQRADAIMLAHLPADRDSIYLMSLPRDSWVTNTSRAAGSSHAHAGLPAEP